MLASGLGAMLTAKRLAGVALTAESKNLSHAGDDAHDQRDPLSRTDGEGGRKWRQAKGLGRQPIIWPIC